MLSAGSVSGQLHSNPDIGYPLLDAEHSLCTAPWSGTPSRTTSAHSRTTSPLDRVWKPGISPDTSVFSALETFVIIELYKSTFTIPYHTTTACVLLLLFWHAPLRVCSTIHRHQPPQRTVLGQVDCFVQCEAVSSQIALDGVQPRDTRTPWWSLPVVRWGSR